MASRSRIDQAEQADQADLIRPINLLLPFQGRFLEDRAPGITWEASRQIGKTFALTLKAILETSRSKRPIESVYGSASARQVYKAGREMKKHIRVLKIATDDMIRSEKENTEMFVFPEDRILNLVPSNPDTTPGFSGHVYLDEFALHRDGKAIWKGVFPAITRGFGIRVCSTHRGKKTKFYELTQNQKYSRHRTTIYDAVAEGLMIRDEDGHQILPEDLKRLLADDEAWLEEYMVEPQDETTAWLTHEMLAAVEEERIDHEPAWVEALIEKAQEAYRYFKLHKTDPPWWPAFAAKYTAALQEIEDPLDLGMDIGRERDLSIIWILRRGSLAKPTLVIITLKKQPFYVQKAVLFALLPFIMRKGRACIDRSGLGRQLAEEAEDKFGSKVEGIDFTNEHKEALAVGLKNCIQDYGVLIPKDDVIRTSLHSVKKMLTSTGKARFDAERSEKIGHADHFWALAMAVHASTSEFGNMGILNFYRELYLAQKAEGEKTGAMVMRLMKQGLPLVLALEIIRRVTARRRAMRLS